MYHGCVGMFLKTFFKKLYAKMNRTQFFAIDLWSGIASCTKDLNSITAWSNIPERYKNRMQCLVSLGDSTHVGEIPFWGKKRNEDIDNIAFQRQLLVSYWETNAFPYYFHIIEGRQITLEQRICLSSTKNVAKTETKFYSNRTKPCALDFQFPKLILKTQTSPPISKDDVYLSFSLK